MLSKKIKSGLYTTPGGKVEIGESFKEAAVRELYEETGLVCCIEDLIYLGMRTIDGMCIQFFKVISWTGEVVNLENTIHLGWIWVKLETIKDSLLVPGLRGRR